MRVEHREVTWYTLAELKEHNEKAYESALQRLDTHLWESEAHNEGIAETVVMEFAMRIGEPKAPEFGESDYPGIPDVKLKGWAVQERGAHVSFTGTLTRQAAPNLPWHDWIEDVALTNDRYGTGVHVRESEQAPYVGWNKTDPALKAVLDEMESAVGAALGEALYAGEREADSKSSPEYLDDLADVNEWEFTENGEWS